MKKHISFVLSLALLAACTPAEPLSPVAQFAQCMTEQGTILYGSATCPACKKQTAILGEAFAEIKEIDCDAERQQCLNAGVTATPTWEFPDGSRLASVAKLTTLEERSGCVIDWNSNSSQ